MLLCRRFRMAPAVTLSSFLVSNSAFFPQATSKTRFAGMPETCGSIRKVAHSPVMSPRFSKDEIVCPVAISTQLAAGLSN
ncbi:hypothetical protein BMS3Bbin11_01312 [bacterium BMS3Bbin11]|nr:hypothetical protein BMS3Bbin11_01312 [bacterium BMS3Bbin11]